MKDLPLPALSAHPRLLRVASAAQALGLPSHHVLHAGPPLLNPQQPPPVLLSSAVMTCLHAGWAASEAEAEALVHSGGVTWEPAQARGCVVPLAFTVASDTPLFVVDDGHDNTVCAPVSTVRGADTRMGQRDPALAERLRRRDTDTAPRWQHLLAAHGPLPLLPLAAAGLADGDDLHSRTAAATAALAAWVQAQGDEALAADIAATPLFFLTLWMAASAMLLRSAGACGRPSWLSRAGGNGERFGITLAGAPGTWTCVDATPPLGRIASTWPLCGAIGDSAVIDLCGFGGLALAAAPEPLSAFAGFLPPDHATLAGRLLGASHAGLGRRVVVDAQRVVEAQATPLIALAMLAADGRHGFAGRGLYRPPLALFAEALRSQAGQAGGLGL
jgi:hypothetical protein